MKKLFLILLFPFLINAQSFFNQEDKQKHIAVGCTISAITYNYVYTKTESKAKAFFWSLGMSVLAGATKEGIDQLKYKGWNNQDVGATALGGFTASVTFNILTQKNK